MPIRSFWTVKHFLLCLFSLLLQFISWIVQPESLHFHVSSLSQQDDYTDASISSSPIVEATTTTEDPTFITAQGSSFFIADGQGDTSSLSYNTDCQSKEDLAGSYHYTATGATPPEVQAHPAGRSTPNGGFLLRQHFFQVLKSNEFSCLKKGIKKSEI